MRVGLNALELAPAWLAVGAGLARDGLDGSRRKAAPTIFCNAPEIFMVWES